MTDIGDLDRLVIALDPLGQAAVAAALVLVMFGVALGLTLQDFRILTKQPRLYFGGVAAQVLLLPLVTVGLLHLLAPPPSIALGMIVVACCPGGTVSNLLTYFGRGSVAVSVALTATSSVLAAVLTPASILFWSNQYPPTADLLATLAVDPWLFIVQTTLLLAVPVLAGMALAARAPDLAKRIRHRVTTMGAAVLIGAIIYGSWHFFPILWPAAGVLFAVVVIHNSAAFITGAIVSTMLTSDKSARRAVIFEVGIQNSGLALIILLAQLNGVGGAAAIAAVWGLWHIVAGATLAAVFRARSERLVVQYTDV